MSDEAATDEVRCNKPNTSNKVISITSPLINNSDNVPFISKTSPGKLLATSHMYLNTHQIYACT